MLDAWRVHRVPALADLIDRATCHLPTHDRPLGATVEEVEDAWDRALGDPAAMPQLLQNLFVMHGEAGLGARLDRRIKQLARLPDDPRIALRLAEVSGWRRVDFERTRFWRPLFELLARHRDLRTRDALRAQVVVPVTEYSAPHERIAVDVLGDFVRDPRSAFGEDYPPKLPVAAQAQLPAIAARLDAAEAEARIEWDLVAVITDDWDDDGPRMIYADWLIERGHPRGEYILLDTKRRRSGLTPGEAERYQELREIPYLVGTLDELSSTTVRERERGLDRELVTYRCAGTLGWRAAARAPLLAMVETLVLDPQTVHPPLPADFARVVLAARSLDTVHNVPARLAAAAAPLVAAQFRHRDRTFERIR